MGTEEEAYGVIKGKLEERYQLNTDDYIFGWLDINHMQHVERLNEMNSIFITHLDILDQLDKFKICTSYSI